MTWYYDSIVHYCPDERGEEMGAPENQPGFVWMIVVVLAILVIIGLACIL